MGGSLADARTQPGSAKTVADILTAAADLIEPEGRWTQGAFARTGKGRVIGPCEKAAECFCGIGAIYRVGGVGHLSDAAMAELDRYARRRRHDMFAGWNDTEGRTQAEVVAALRASAAKATGQ